MDASNPTVIRSYENKITELERGKIVLAEQLVNQAESKGNWRNS